MLKAYKYRIYPNKEQQKLMEKHFGSVRHVYNWGLEQKNKHYKKTKKNLSRFELQDQLVASKKRDKPWLTEVNSQALLAALLNLDQAFTHFFQGRTKFPRFKKKYGGWQSYQCPQNVNVDFQQGIINLPKIKGVRAKFHRRFTGQIKTVTIKRSPSDKYFASVLVEDGKVLPKATTVVTNETLGLDVGLTHFLISSDGNKIENPRFFKKALSGLAIEQRKLSRKPKGTNNRKKQKLLVAKVHERIANKRHDFIHQETAKLAVKNHATSFAVEDLNIKGMIRNRKLSRAIQDCGWGLFIRALTYKCEWNGKNLIKIDRFAASSKTCHCCGKKQEKMPLSIREWECECGVCHDRDINAAKVIKQLGIAQPPGQNGGYVKCSPAARPLCDGAAARGLANNANWVVGSPH